MEEANNVCAASFLIAVGIATFVEPFPSRTMGWNAKLHVRASNSVLENVWSC